MADDRPPDPDVEDDEPLGLEPIEEDEPREETGTLALGDADAGDDADVDDPYSLAPPKETRAPSVLPPVPIAEPEAGAGDPLLPGEGTIEILSQAPYAPPVDEPKTVDRSDGTEEVEELPLPTLSPLDGFGLLTWAFRGREAGSWMAVFAVVMLSHMGTWFTQFTPIVGRIVWYSLVLVILFFTGAYQVRVALAGLRGAAGPPHWPRFSPDTATRSEALSVFALELMYAIPVLVAYLAVHPALAIPLALVALALYPLSLMLLAVTGSLRMALPFQALGAAIGDGRRYAIVVAPGLAWFLLKLGTEWTDPGFFESVVDSFFFPVAVYTSLFVGLFARENRSMTAIVLRTDRRRKQELARLEEDWEARKKALEEQMPKPPPPPDEYGED